MTKLLIILEPKLINGFSHLNKQVPLIIAVIVNNFDIVKLLINNGANVNIKNNNSDNPLDLAKNNNCIEIKNFLKNFHNLKNKIESLNKKLEKTKNEEEKTKIKNNLKKIDKELETLLKIELSDVIKKMS